MISADGEHPWRFFQGGFPDSWEGNLFRTDFRVWLKRDWLLGRDGLTEAERAELTLRLCYREVRKGAEAGALLRGAAWFAGCGESDRITLLRLKRRVWEHWERVRAEDAGRRPLFSYFWDYREIWASFRAEYGIDLYTAELHWFAFSALLRGLPPESALGRHMASRDKDDKADQREYLMSRVNAVPADC